VLGARSTVPEELAKVVTSGRPKAKAASPAGRHSSKSKPAASDKK
jgi:hypothetical protein